MYIKKPSYGFNPLRKVTSFSSRKSSTVDDDVDSFSDKKDRNPSRATSLKNGYGGNGTPVDDYDDTPPKRSRSVGRSRSKRDRSHHDRSDRSRPDRGADHERSDKGHHRDRRDHRDHHDNHDNHDNHSTHNESHRRRDRGNRDHHHHQQQHSHKNRDRGNDRHHNDDHDYDRASSRRSSRPKNSISGGDRSRSSRGQNSSSNAPVSKKSKVVIPQGISFRPGRLQSLTADEEIILKQIWAYMLKYCGYDITISSSDIKYKECFVPSSSSVASTDSNGLSRTATRTSLQSATSGKTSASKKKKGGFFGGGSSKPEVAHAPADSPRLIEIQTKSSSERYEPSDVPMDSVINAFVNHYKLTSEFNSKTKHIDDDDYSDDNSSDVNSMESFVTAETTITNPDDFPTQSYSSKKGNNGRGATSANSMYHSGSVAKSPIETHPEINADIARIKPEDLQKAIFKALRADLLDNFILRFVRARKWNTDNAIKMLTNSIIWRNDFPANDWIMEGDAPSYLHGRNQGLVKNFTAEKSWIRGEDMGENPIFWFMAKKHFGSDSPSDETQRYAVITIEWCRLFLREVNESCDTCSIVFDLTGFTLKNADYTTIKFLADVFEAHYPECLGRIYVHNAPWIFSTVWNIIKNWLDPVVASKIVFTKNFKDLSGYISPDYIPEQLGGIDKSGPDYPIPQPGDDVPPKPIDATYKRLEKERDELLMRLFTNTIRWVESTNPDVSSKYLEERIGINIELSNNYIEIDPYVRCPGPYDRNGSLKLRN